MQPTTLEIIASLFFALAVLHTFLVKRFQHLARRFPEGSVGENLFHMLGEVEIVFGLWAALFVLAFAYVASWSEAVRFVEGLVFTEPMFVFVIMAMAATRPVLSAAVRLINLAARFLPLKGSTPFYWVALTVGPLLGSLITEPAAMTITALLLRDTLFGREVSDKLKYATLGVLFVNVSIGGTLTHFAAPPVLMVAGIWQWDSAYMLSHFGWKAAIAVAANASLCAAYFYRELSALPAMKNSAIQRKPPLWLIAVHFGFLALTVISSHHAAIFLGAFLFFLGVTTITKEYQDEIKLRESLLVGFFLGGLVVLGSLQSWWLSPLLASMGEGPLFLGTTLLTAFTDNAALTYLGAQVPNLSDAMKYALVAGAVTGGGLTVIANAPNPAGFSILQSSFGEEGISPLFLAAGALLPTAVAAATFWLL